MQKIEFTTNEKAEIVHKLKDFFDDKLNQEIGSFDAEFLIDFFAEDIGAYFYNRGLQDAQVVLSQKLEEAADGLYALERPTALSRT